MRKFLTALLLSVSALLFASCMSGEISSSEQHSASSVTVELSELPETATAELGERFDIPEVTATKGGKELSVEVSVKDSKGEDVELQGRGTRFSATDMNGYVITFSAGEGEEKVVKTMNVQVSDTKGPELSLPAAADNMTVKKGATVSIPVASWTDKSEEVTDSGYKVMFGDAEIPVVKGEGGTPDTFLAEEYGEYIVTYTAKDKFDNRTETPIVIECVRSVVLANFDDLSKVWASEDYSEIVSEHAVEGNALKISCNKGWQMIAVYPEYYDLGGFDKLQITIYSDVDMDTSDEGFYLLNKRYTLSEGENIVTITKEDLDSQYPDGRIPSTARAEYYDLKYLWFQVKSESGSIWVDNLIGIFDNYTQDSKAPTVDLGTQAPHDKLSFQVGRKLVVPTAVAYDNSMEDTAVSCVVTDKSGADITAEAIAGTYIVRENEAYKIVYTATDKSGNVGTKTVDVEVLPKADIPDTEKASYFPQNREYDLLQDFEDGGVDWCTVEKSFETEHVMNGEKSVRLSTASADCCVVMKLLKNGKRLETKDWAKYAYIQAYVYADCEGARFDFYGKTNYLQIGPNVITITSEEIIAEIAKAANVYDATGGFYFQLTTGTVYVDCIIGVYPEGYVPEEEPPEEVENYYPQDREYDVLQDFESANAIDTWFFEGSEGMTTAHALKEHSFRVTAAKADWAKLPLMIKKNGAVLTEEDWNAYEAFRLVIYSKNACTFAFLNKIYDLTAGYNVIEISKADLLAQINANAECYSTAGYFWCQVNGTDVDLYFDELIGIYPDGYVPEEELPDELKNYYPQDREYDVLQDFESANAIDTWFFEGSEGMTTAHALKEHSFRVTAAKADWAKLPLMIKKNGAVLTEEDWNAYEAFRLVIYSKNACTFAFLNKIYDLTAGYNVIEISKADLLAQINANAECYSAAGYFWCQVNGTDVDLYFDEFIGIYPAENAA